MNSLSALLEQELTALQAVLATLQTERAALQDRSAEALLVATNAKSEAVARAVHLEQERRALVEAIPGNLPAAASRSLAELKRLATECRQHNDANGLLIRGQRRRIEGSLNVLRGGRAAADTYGRDGETRHLRGPRTTLASY